MMKKRFENVKRFVKENKNEILVNCFAISMTAIVIKLANEIVNLENELELEQYKCFELDNDNKKLIYLLEKE